MFDQFTGHRLKTGNLGANRSTPDKSDNRTFGFVPNRTSDLETEVTLLIPF
jgi:hypothetical protein